MKRVVMLSSSVRWSGGALVWLGLLALGGVACSSDATGPVGPQAGAAGAGGAAASGGAAGSGITAGNGGTGAERAQDSGRALDGAALTDVGSFADGGSSADGVANGGDAFSGEPLADGPSDAASASRGCVVPATENDQPNLLSQTGCIDIKSPNLPAPGLIPYDVSSPLWSDGAKKARFISLPAGKKMHVKDCAREPTTCNPTANPSTATFIDEGHWDMPVGAVLVKNFSIGDKLIETRLFMRMSADSRGWLGFSYEWNEAQTEATLLPTQGRDSDRMVGTQPWHYPTRAECLQCHTEAAGRSLGPSTQQLNFEFAYPSGKKNQVDELTARGLFESPPNKALGVYPTPTVPAAGDLATRARSYMQTNCAICHRQGGVVEDVDLRFDNATMLAQLCNQAIIRGTGETPPLRMVPGKPADSALSFRMHAPQIGLNGGARMPKIGSVVVDVEGTKLIDDWITSVAACPR